MTAASRLNLVLERMVREGDAAPHVGDRAVVESEPFLDGRTMIIAGHWNQEAVVYPVSREAPRRGRSLINWVAMLPSTLK